jgi:hypothetical protein
MNWHDTIPPPRREVCQTRDGVHHLVKRRLQSRVAPGRVVKLCLTPEWPLMGHKAPIAVITPDSEPQRAANSVLVKLPMSYPSYAKK